MFPQAKIDARRLSAAFFTLLLLLTAAALPAWAGSPEPTEKATTEKATNETATETSDEDWEDDAEDVGRSFLYKEIVLSTGFSSESTDRIELSPRPPGSYVALDYVRTFTSASPINQKLPKWLQLSAVDLHPRVVYYSEIDEDDDMEMEGIDWPMPEGDRADFAPQDFWVRFQLAGNDRLSLRVGQIALPYGVNPLMAPRQTFILPLEEIDMGLKWDWGIGLKGPLGKLDWELAMTAGTGEAWHSRSKMQGEASSRLLTGRLGTPTYWDAQYGLSFLVGNLPHLHGPYVVEDWALSRWRVSLDGLYKKGTYLMFGGQVTYGEDGYDGDEEHVVATSGLDVAELLGYRAWVDWVTPVANDLRLSAQYENLNRARDVGQVTDSAVTLEVTYSLSTAMSLKVDFRSELENSMDMKENAFFVTFIFYSR